MLWLGIVIGLLLGVSLGMPFGRNLQVSRLRSVCDEWVRGSGGPNRWAPAARAEWVSAKAEGRPPRITLVGGEWLFSAHSLPKDLRLEWVPGGEQ